LSNPIFPIDVKDTAIGDNVGIVDVKSLTAVTYGGKVSYYKNGGEDYTGGHYGTDYRAVDISFSGCEGKAVYAVENGTVVNVKSDDGLVHIKHVIPLVLYDGSHSYKEWFTTYAHMKDIKVKTGITVKKGDIIGYISNTNYLKDPKMAKHLHFAVTTRLYEGKASYHYAYPYAKDKVKLKEYSNATISPYWLGGSYRNVNYKAYTSDIADNSAVKRITCDTSVAPASTFGK
jgi:murein DD-endopeptidase MepM/ murein hydrolase activator NlpD